jgi:hypothetical protein
MLRRVCAGLIVLLVISPALWSQDNGGLENPPRFHWQAGQVLDYHITEDTAVFASIEELKVEKQTRLTLTRRWKVLDVDAGGVATVQMSVTAMAFEMSNSGGEPLRFDSAEPDKSNPQLREQMSQYVGKPLAVLRIDSQGRVVEAKESGFGPASQYQMELPFLVQLPGSPVKVGMKWQREFPIILAPPHGTGEKYDATQSYHCRTIAGKYLHLDLHTTLKSTPEIAEQASLFQFQPEGELVFDTQAGRLHRATLEVNKALKDYPSPGSVYTFQRRYTAEYAGGR